MRLQEIIVVSILFCFPILSMPAASSALTITFDAGSGPPPPVPPGQSIDISQVDVPSPDGVFMIRPRGGVGSAIVSADESAGVIRILITNIEITAPPLTSPRTLVITVSSDNDFRLLPIGTYPAGVRWRGSFSGPGGTVATTGDSISATGFASGDPINRTPLSPLDVGPSLPSFCTGMPGCMFVVSPVNDTFGENPPDEITEPDIQCPLAGEFGETCQPLLSLVIPITFQPPENSVGSAVATSMAMRRPAFRPPGDSVEFQLILAQSTTPRDATPLSPALACPTPFDAFSAALKRDGERFELWSAFTLNSVPENNEIAPEREFVSLRIGSFLTMIPPGSFTQPHERGGKFFTFTGVIDGVHLSAAIRPLGDPIFRSFVFWAKGEGADLAGIKDPVTVELTIGDDCRRTVAVPLDEWRKAEDP